MSRSLVTVIESYLNLRIRSPKKTNCERSGSIAERMTKQMNFSETSLNQRSFQSTELHTRFHIILFKRVSIRAEIFNNSEGWIDRRIPLMIFGKNDRTKHLNTCIVFLLTYIISVHQIGTNLTADSLLHSTHLKACIYIIYKACIYFRYTYIRKCFTNCVCSCSSTHIYRQSKVW